MSTLSDLDIIENALISNKVKIADALDAVHRLRNKDKNDGILLKRMKYIVFDNHFPVLIPSENGMSHADVYIKEGQFNIDREPTSAGFCLLKGKSVDCFGESVSLNFMKSDQKRDSSMIKQQFYY